MRVFATLALALSLAGCNGDRIKQSMNGRQAQPEARHPKSSAIHKLGRPIAPPVEGQADLFITRADVRKWTQGGLKVRDPLLGEGLLS